MEDNKQESEATPTSAPTKEETYSWAEIESLVEEARQEGYLRGRNEQIEQVMRRPGIYRSEATSPTPQPVDEPFLAHIRPSVWD